MVTFIAVRHCKLNAAENFPRDSLLAMFTSFSLFPIAASYSTSWAYVRPLRFSPDLSRFAAYFSHSFYSSISPPKNKYCFWYAINGYSIIWHNTFFSQWHHAPLAFAASTKRAMRRSAKCAGLRRMARLFAPFVLTARHTRSPCAASLSARTVVIPPKNGCVES